MLPGLDGHEGEMPKNAVPEMTTCAQYQPVAWWWTRKRIGGELSKLYEVPKELPPELVWLVGKLDDDRDWLFPSVSWQRDVDVFLG
jgi:hypothetical protein